MASLLEFTNSSLFRKRLLTRNLTPYAKAPNRPTQPSDDPYIQTDSSVQDSPDQLIDEPSFANQLYPLNQYGAEGGYKQVPDPGALLNTRSNEGEYGFQDANIVDQSVLEQQKWKPLNAYSNGSQTQLDAGSFIDTLERPGAYMNRQNNQPYPTTFVPSTFGPATILLFKDPQGSNGFLSQDSYIQRLGAETLRREFEQRIAAEIRRQTIGRANIANVTSGTDLLNVITGVVPALEPNYTITVPLNPVNAAANFALRLAGSILPVSPIPGSYFDTSINPRNSTTLQQLGNAFRQSAVGSFINNLLGPAQTGSQIMFNNLGAGQKSRLFDNIDYNRFKPNLPRNIFDRVAGAVTGTQTDNSNYYIGSITSEPSRVFSPSGALPNDTFGREIQAPVYGPTELAQLYEGPDKEIKLGANGPTYSNGGGIEGGFTWVSPKYKGNAGKRVGIGGEVTREDEDFKPSSYNSTESTNITFKQGSILDETQRLINSQPQGGKRLQHVGNAIDQVSKVFNDGYKELTKGSRVYRYEGALGQEVGTEYCRVFAKDTPYLQFNDLQKVDGITTNGRRFSYSVLDNTYNLNIVPNKQEGGQDSTNIIGTTNNAYAKKYMFSLENLAWRTSSAPGYSVADLAVCERGPNGGRVMWFPPYGLTFTESVSTNWNSSDFLGRPEPIYTYKNTSRTGTLNWKIVVDHPSVLNLIVNKVLADETNRVRVDSILESFFAGCRKYDLYELAKKYYTVNPNDLYQLQEAISSKEMTREQMEYSKQQVQSGYNTPNGESTSTSASGGVQKNFSEYLEGGFYFGNDLPKKDAVTSYNSQYSLYIQQKPTYEKKPDGQNLANFFNDCVTSNYEVMKQLAIELGKELTQNTQGTITITIDTSCSAPASVGYNAELSKRRFESIKQFFQDQEPTKKFVDKTLLIKAGSQAGEQTSSTPFKFSKEGDKYNPASRTQLKNFNCSKDNPNAVGGDTVGDNEVFTVGAMSCRRGVIKSIENKTSSNVPKSEPTPKYTEELVGKVVTETVTTQETSREWKPRDNITKRVLRVLLSECDYFEVLKAETPMVFDNLKDKLKFFHPSFHSITPEGLNTRLTFLQQCMRPGDTIPTIKQKGDTQVIQYNNAINTAFGAPPVLVLRIGDFYNTKITPTSLQLTYEELDLNPEGIGVQPMIATVSMNFNFIGGSGLKESVDKLQNALTFNYYANAEIYDDRADVTYQEDFLKVLDKEFLAMSPPPGAPALNQAAVENGQSNNNTIGTILTSNITASGETGTITYSDFMENFVKQTQTYFQNVINRTKESVSQYNNAVRQQWMVERNYVNGKIETDSGKNFELFGKPANIEKRFDTIFKALQDDIDKGNDKFIKYIASTDLELSPRLQKTIKTNYMNFVKNKKGSFQSAITKITQDMTQFEQSYLQILSRVNIITYNGSTGRGTDGLQKPNGDVRIYQTSGTTDVDPTSAGATNTLQELENDIVKVINDMEAFNNIVQSEQSFVFGADGKTYKGTLVLELQNSKATEPTEKTVFVPFTESGDFGDLAFKRCYMILSDDVVDSKKYESFKQALIGNTTDNPAVSPGGLDDIGAVFDSYWLKIAKPQFESENKITMSFIESLEKEKLKNFLVNYSPFVKKKRVLEFDSEKTTDDAKRKDQENLIKYLSASTNKNNTKGTWNDPDGSNSAFYSKVKLN